MKRIRRDLFSATICLALCLSHVLLAIDASAPDKRNVILIIGDGMDDQQITMARNYLKGAAGRLRLDQLPVRSAVQILTVDEKNPDKPVYVADSANTATSLATGHVTSRGRIATSALEDEDLTTITSLAKAAGYRTGLVTTARVTDATPASFVAHISHRDCEGPTMMKNAENFLRFIVDCSADLKSNGGPGSISEQIAESDLDLVLGGGLQHFVVPAEGSSDSVLDVARHNGFQVITTTRELTGTDPSRTLLGLFAEDTIPVRLQGEGGRVAEKPDPSFLNRLHWALGSVRLPEPMSCEANPEFEGMPSLRQMTAAALAHLNAAGHSKGFFLMIESASIDKQAHLRNPCGHIGELEQLEETLDAALLFARDHPQTLILVTADHGHAAQIIPDESPFLATGVPVYSPGHVARVKTPEGAIMAINYATNNFPLEDHTGVNVPLFANQAGQDIVPPMVTQPGVFDIMASYLRLMLPVDASRIQAID